MNLDIKKDSDVKSVTPITPIKKIKVTPYNIGEIITINKQNFKVVDIIDYDKKEYYLYRKYFKL